MTPQVTHLRAEEVTAAFSHGKPLVQDERLRVHASRRVQPGMAEFHARETDIFYFITGAATLVTGGTIMNPQTVDAGEVRGDSIGDGEAHAVGKGDVVIVPAGLPHWFKEVRGLLLYFTVKVVSENPLATS